MSAATICALVYSVAVIAFCLWLANQKPMPSPPDEPKKKTKKQK